MVWWQKPSVIMMPCSPVVPCLSGEDARVVQRVAQVACGHGLNPSRTNFNRSVSLASMER